MLATSLTFVFLTAALLAVVTITASLAKGFAAASVLWRQLAVVSDRRTVTIRHERIVRAPALATLRAARRPSRPAPALAAQARRRVAA